MKDTFYFPHDYNAANDPKMLKIRARFDNFKGYGIIFALFETMAQEENGHIDRGAIGGLSLGYSTPIRLLNDIINYSLKIKLFSEDENGIYNKRMMDHKKIRDSYKEFGKQGAEARWGKKNTPPNSTPNTPPNSPPNSTPNAKESKVKGSKGYITVGGGNGNKKSLLTKRSDIITSKDHLAYMVDYISTSLNDTKSNKYYNLVAKKIPEHVIMGTLAEIKADGAKNPAAVFIYKMEKYALSQSKT
jgi:hypothetical protein